MDSDSPSPRRPLQLCFEPPAQPGSWHLTGRFNWPSPGYGAVPCCEWMDDAGAKIWLSARYVDLAASVGARRSRYDAMIEKADEFLGRLLPTRGEGG